LNYRSTIVGIAASAILLAVLGIARLFTVSAVTPDLTIREVETLTLTPPPPPPQENLPDTPPPPPALTEVSILPDPTRVPIPKAQIPMDITAPVESFFTDLAPAPLPVTPEPKRIAPSEPLPTRQPPTTKSHYSASEIDGTPRLLRHGSAIFPSSLARKGVTRGTVTFEVELSTSGAVSVRRVVSATHQELVSAARSVASSARFTAPMRNGKSVKVIMNWPIVIQK